MQTGQNSFSDNSDFLVLCRQAFRSLYNLDKTEPCRVNNAGTENPKTQKAARRHRLAGLLDAAFHGLHTGIQKSHLYACHSVYWNAEAGRLYQMFESAGLRPILIKGPGLAQQAWPEPALRSFDDLDFRFSHKDFPKLCKILDHAGYQHQPGSLLYNAQLWHYGWGVSFVHPDGFTVEANHRLFPPVFPCPKGLGRDGLLPVETLQFDGIPLRVPTPCAHLLLACMHALWHGTERLAWIVDIAGLLVRHDGIAVQAARLAHGNRFTAIALEAGIRISEELFGPGLCSDAKSELTGKESGRAAAAAELYIEMLMDGTGPTFDNRNRLYQTLMSRHERRLLAIKRAVIPGDRDFRSISLPPALRLLYWIYRPMRIAIRRIPKTPPPAHPNESS